VKFKANSRRRAAEYEKDLIQYWKDNQTFEKSVDNRPKENGYVFYDGPPFITGVPHHGTLLSSVVKDAVPRFWTMKGKRVERVWGWDCHGLPAEVYTEKKLGITDKKDIGTKISLEDYILACRENMVQTGNLWEDTISRIGRWVDFKGAYKTMDKEYMESIWWAFKTLYDKGKIYEGEKVLMYCTHDATPLAKAEIAMDNSYQDVTDPSVYVKFKLLGWPDTVSEEGVQGAGEKLTEPYQQYGEGASEPVTQQSASETYLLAWTTTPWTLNANTAIAISKDVEYAEVAVEGNKLILAKDLIEKALTDEKHQVLSHEILRTFMGAELIGKSYEPLFENRGENAHKIWDAWFIHTNEGTGIAHEAPAYGEEDYQLAKENNVPLVIDTNDEGYYTEGEWQGKQVWEVNKEIAKTLHERGVVWKIDYIKHSYPHCHRCGTKLMYRAVPSWFMDINGQRQEMLDQNQDINWFPKHIKHGRFEKTVESAPDWNLSRDRFWATAMPVWKGTDENGTEHIKVIGSYAELKELSGQELEDYHRPWVDDITFTIDGTEYKRIDKVMDSWFEAGSMPFAQFHYPFENVEKFEANYPGDFIAEYVGQVRAWFYYLHAVSTGLFGNSSYKNVIVTGTVAGNDGRKMSKSYGNFTDPNMLMDQYSADSLRFLLLSSPLLNGEDFSLIDKDVSDVARKLSMIWNMYDFFTMYADVDGWEWDPHTEATNKTVGKADGSNGLSAPSGLDGAMLTSPYDNTALSASSIRTEISSSSVSGSHSNNPVPTDPSSELTNSLDIWIVSRVHQLTQHVHDHMEQYDIPNALEPVLPFLDDASNWYVRRSRRRFWKTEDDGDKNQAYQTLHYVLVRLSLVLAPFTPFLAEELYHKLTGGESVHLLDWPENGSINEESLNNMKLVREYINDGLSQRAAAGIKARQPLSFVQIPDADALNEQLKGIIQEELNVRSIESATDGGENVQVRLDLEITPDLKREGLIREVIRHVQNARKQAGLQIDDRIELVLISDDAELSAAIEEHKDTITAETLAIGLVDGSKGLSYLSDVSVEGKSLTIELQKS
jgi:isoleucyl-tRNA synthetase